MNEICSKRKLTTIMTVAGLRSTFCLIFFCPTTFGPISKKRSLVKETLNPNPNPKPYWTKRRGRSVLGQIVVARKVGSQ